MSRSSSVVRVALVVAAVAASFFGCGNGDPVSPARPASDPAASGNCPGPSESPEAGALPAAAIPARLKSYREIREALLSGARVRLSINYKLCTKDGGPGVDATSSTEVDTFQLSTPTQGPSSIEISKSNLAWIYRDGYEYLWNYGQIRFDEDGTVSVRAQYYKPITFVQSLDEELRCGLDADGSAGGDRGMSVFKEPNAPRRLTSLPDLLGVLGGGAPAHALVDLAGCQKLEDKKAVGAGPRIVERIPFVLNEYFGKSVVGNPAAFLATSHAALHLRPDGIASRYAKLRINATGDASVLIMENKPVALEPIASAEYTCPLATTATGAGVSLFGF